MLEVVASDFATLRSTESTFVFGPVRLAVFDLDRTLLPGASLAHLARSLATEGVVKRRTVARHALRATWFARRGLGDHQVDQTRAHVLGAVAGLEYERLREAATCVGTSLVDRLYLAGRFLVDMHLGVGDFCVLLSSSPQELVEAVGAGLGVQRSFGTRAEVEDGRCTGGLVGDLCYGPAKVSRLKRELGPVELSSAYAYADSASDAPS